MTVPKNIPKIVFHTRVRNAALGGSNPFEWKELASEDFFRGRRIVVFALPGAFTPTCSESHLPGYERAYDDLRRLGVDEVACLSVNDAFVMFQWAKAQGVTKVFMLPDGNGDFTRGMGMLSDRGANGMGMRSWRYSMLVEDGEIVALFEEPGRSGGPKSGSPTVSGAEHMLAFLAARAPMSEHLK